MKKLYLLTLCLISFSATSWASAKIRDVLELRLDYHPPQSAQTEFTLPDRGWHTLELSYKSGIKPLDNPIRLESIVFDADKNVAKNPQMKIIDLSCQNKLFQKPGDKCSIKFQLQSSQSLDYPSYLELKTDKAEANGWLKISPFVPNYRAMTLRAASPAESEYFAAKDIKDNKNFFVAVVANAGMEAIKFNHLNLTGDNSNLSLVERQNNGNDPIYGNHPMCGLVTDSAKNKVNELTKLNDECLLIYKIAKEEKQSRDYILFLEVTGGAVSRKLKLTAGYKDRGNSNLYLNVGNNLYSCKSSLPSGFLSLDKSLPLLKSALTNCELAYTFSKDPGFLFTNIDYDNHELYLLPQKMDGSYILKCSSTLGCKQIPIVSSEPIKDNVLRSIGVSESGQKVVLFDHNLTHTQQSYLSCFMQNNNSSLNCTKKNSSLGESTAYVSYIFNRESQKYNLIHKSFGSKYIGFYTLNKIYNDDQIQDRSHFDTDRVQPRRDDTLSSAYIAGPVMCNGQKNLILRAGAQIEAFNLSHPEFKYVTPKQLDTWKNNDYIGAGQLYINEIGEQCRFGGLTIKNQQVIPAIYDLNSKMSYSLFALDYNTTQSKFEIKLYNEHALGNIRYFEFVTNGVTSDISYLQYFNVGY